MQQLSKQLIHSETNFPEKILQFGTGILLRGLPDFFIDKANKAGIFQGKIVVIKSTSGGTDDFQKQDGLFTTCIRGVLNEQVIDENIINESISRVISANEHWHDILIMVRSTDLQIIISNTTEVGIQYVEESIFATPPASFPAKLTAILYERFKNQLGGLVIIPTELIPDNGLKLKSIVLQLVAFNQLGDKFRQWVEKENFFCSSLVDRIVTNAAPEIKQSLPYQDDLAIQTEPYRLWAIQGNEKVKEILSFAQADTGVIIAENIDYYRERKLRLLNGTHTISVCKGYLQGFNTVYECMQDIKMQSFIKSVMLEEIAPTVLAQDFQHFKPTKKNLETFAHEILDRFNNPYTMHYLLSITLQATSKMKMRNIPTILRYYQQFGKAPTLMAEGFKAYLLFMRVVKEENGKFYGKRGKDFYLIQDDYAPYFAKKWKNVNFDDMQAIDSILNQIYSDADIWGTDLTKIQGFLV